MNDEDTKNIDVGSMEGHNVPLVGLYLASAKNTYQSMTWSNCQHESLSCPFVCVASGNLFQLMAMGLDLEDLCEHSTRVRQLRVDLLLHMPMHSNLCPDGPSMACKKNIRFRPLLFDSKLAQNKYSVAGHRLMCNKL